MKWERIVTLAQRGGREAATHLVYKYFAKTTDLCREKSENSPRTAIRPTVLIRPLQFRFVRVPLDCIAKLCIRKDNIASLTCLMTYSHKLQLYAGIYSPTEPKTTLYTCTCRTGGCSRSHRTASTNRVKADHRQTFTKWFNFYDSQCDIDSR